MRRPVPYPSPIPPPNWDEDSYPYEEWRFEMYRDAIRDAEEEYYESEED